MMTQTEQMNLFSFLLEIGVKSILGRDNLAMTRSPLFQEIAENLRQEILLGKYKSGDELPTVRAMALRMKCAPGTVQRAYQELNRQGLLNARPGQGTRITVPSGFDTDSPHRKASLINQIESFILGLIKSGNSVYEIEQAFHMALDRWRTISNEQPKPPKQKMRFVGSHDLAVSLLNEFLANHIPRLGFSINFSGSLGGLIALARQEADMAGCHLWDAESGEYNRPFVRRLLPGRKIGLLTLAYRRLGLIIPEGNPRQITGLKDLARNDLRFINRQPGAGTRVWLDSQLQRLDILPKQVTGYDELSPTHSDVASAVAAKQADIALGIENAALTYGLDFIPLTTECYDLVFPCELLNSDGMQTILQALSSDELKSKIAAMGGYETNQTGNLQWVE